MQDLEILLADGLSTDNTKSEVQRFTKEFAETKVVLIDNPDQAVPYALNKMIALSSGDFIVRIDAHSLYPKNYISTLIGELETRPDAWNVGGCWDTQPGANTKVAKAIVHATSHPFGIGNAAYRLESKATRKVDTVPFGCFRKNVFEKIGLFDEDIIRNQDDEFNARIIQNGGSIYLIPSLKIKYFARANFEKLIKMFYQYGYFKPLVNKKIKSPATVRQFAPPILVLGIILGWLPTLLWTPFIFVYFSGTLLYLLILLTGALLLKDNFVVKWLTFIAFVLIHFSYGYGYLKGIIDFLIFNREKRKKIVNISR